MPTPNRRHNPPLAPILDQIHTKAQALFGRGQVASYIPALAQVPPRQFGMAVAMNDGSTYTAGSAHTPFSLQSITKLFAFVLALKLVGDALWTRVGREPSGAAFNSMVQLETEKGIPRNTFINAGALVITDILTTRYAHLDIALLGALRRLTDDPALNWNTHIAKSERDTAHRNMAMAYFMKSYGNFVNAPELVLDNYCRQCAIEMSCAQLAQATLFLANDGLDIGKDARPGEQFLSPEAARRVNALPVKTGVGCGIVAIVPGRGTVSV